jgi:hypothetical protein
MLFRKRTGGGTGVSHSGRAPLGTCRPAIDAVVGEVELCKVGEDSNGVRDGARDVDANELEGRDSAGRVALHVWPTTMRPRGRGGGGPCPCRERRRITPRVLHLEEQRRLIDVSRLATARRPRNGAGGMLLVLARAA